MTEVAAVYLGLFIGLFIGAFTVAGAIGYRNHQLTLELEGERQHSEMLAWWDNLEPIEEHDGGTP